MNSVTACLFIGFPPMAFLVILYLSLRISGVIGTCSEACLFFLNRAS